MKAFLLFINIWLISNYNLLAQNTKYTKIKDESNIVKEIPNNQQYQYLVFKPGKVTFKTGSSSIARFNYNLLLGEMHFIHPQQADTLSLTDEFTIKYVIVQPDTFYYDSKQGYVKVLTPYKPVRLAVQQQLNVLNSEKEGGYGQSSAVSAIRQYSTYTDTNGQIRKLTIKGDVILTKVNSFFILDQNFRLYPATKTNVITIFKKYKSKVVAYIKDNEVDFNQESDLTKLLQFCSNLP